jgi:hypothetical protein
LVVVLSNELAAFAALAGFSPTGPKSCSDFHLMGNEGTRAWGHNEDEYPSVQNSTYVMEARIGDFRYVAFTYAPDVSGWAWGFNSHGLGHSVNALSPTNITLGIGVNFLARDVLNAYSLDDAASRACTPGLASGQHFNLGSIHEPNRQLLVETSPNGCSVQELRPPTAGQRATAAYHTNVYTSDQLQGIDRPYPPSQQSSVHRLKRLRHFAELAIGSDIDALEQIKRAISDTKDSVWPVHRSAKPPDVAMTLNSVLFDVTAAKVSVWAAKPAASAAPTLEYNWQTLWRVDNTHEKVAVVTFI